MSGGAALVTALVLVALATGRLIRWLAAARILDHPNERSSHDSPTPRGGGLAVVPVALLVWMMWSGAQFWVLLAGALALLVVSWADDRHHIPVSYRFALHGFAAAAALAVLPVPDMGIPVLAVKTMAVVALVWFINLYNFMDGIDGITGVETVSIGAGIALVAALSGQGTEAMVPALILAGAALGFLIWNWHPAKIFLGDSGSVPLGLLLGGLLGWLAVRGQWSAALILPAYYWADATITLGRRALAGEKIWQAHRKHFYQRAVRGGYSHAQVSRIILTGNLGLAAAAGWAATGAVVQGLTAAIVITAALLGMLGWMGRNAPP